MGGDHRSTARRREDEVCEMSEQPRAERDALVPRRGHAMLIYFWLGRFVRLLAVDARQQVEATADAATLVEDQAARKEG